MKPSNCKSAAVIKFLTPSVIFLAATLTAPSVISAESVVYKALGSDGSASFSDNQNSIRAKNKNSLPASLSAIRTDQFSSDTLGGRNKEIIDVSEVEITSPSNNQTFSTSDDSILISVKLGPDNNLPEGFTTEIRMNGFVVSNNSRTQSYVPMPMEGPHIFETRIVNSNGETLAQSRPITITVR